MLYLVKFLEEWDPEEPARPEDFKVFNNIDLGEYLDGRIDRELDPDIQVYAFDPINPSFIAPEDIDCWIEDIKKERLLEEKHREEVSSPYWSGRI